jgi:hypothetical protein
MSEETRNEYMLIFRGTDWYSGLSAEETQKVTDQWMAWFKGLMDQGTVTGGRPLEREGKIVSGKNGKVIADGPFLESKESIGGYFMLQVGSMDEAVAIARQCPGLPYGIRVEVRPLATECPSAAKLKPQAALAHA